MKISVPSYKNKNRKKMHAKMLKLGNFTLPLLVYLNNSETENALALAFRSIQWNFIKDIRAKFSIPKLFQSSDIEPISDGGISDFSISGESCIKKVVIPHKTSVDIGMKPGRVTEIDKRNILTSKILTSLLFFRFICNPIYGGFWTHSL